MINETDSVAIFSEGTFEEQVLSALLYRVFPQTHVSVIQILELVEFIARSLPEDDRPAYIASFKDVLKTEENQIPLEEDENRRRAILARLLGEIKQLGEGNDKGVC
jgi:translation initiation factor 3 subunit M